MLGGRAGYEISCTYLACGLLSGVWVVSLEVKVRRRGLGI